jgi:caffeoyl-CoA O-methyltransferase
MEADRAGGPTASTGPQYGSTMPDDPKSFFLSPEIHDYLLAHGTPPDADQERLIAATAEATGPFARMQVAPEQGAFLTILTAAVNARLVVEVGTFTGYSALCFARGVGPDGKVICCDVSEEWTGIGRPVWEAAGVADRIDLRIGPAIDTLRAMPREPIIDLAFVDADKGGYLDYWEELVPRMGINGLLLADNVLWSGNVVDAADTSADTEAIRAFNDHVAADPRVDVVMLPISDGLTIARKR